MKDFYFPENFLWGTATAGHQVEGNNINSESWLLEHLPDTVYKDPSGDACDFYHRYPGDIKLFSELGLNSFRFSLEWARIEPEEGEFSYAELEHYRRMLSTCHEYGIQPFVTMHHFISPRWLIRKGGWLDKKTIDSYARFIEKVSKHMGDLFTGVCTFNEPNIARIIATMMPFSIRDIPFWRQAADAFGVEPEKLGLWQFTTAPEMWDIIHAAHKKAAGILKSGPGNFPVGLSLAMMDFHTAPGGEENAALLKKELSADYLERLSGDDFVGVQTYSRWIVGPDGVIPPGEDIEINQMNEEFYPEAIGGTIRDAAAIAGVPVYVTENGVAMEDDSRRVEYLSRAIKSVAGCIENGIDVRGYFCWSAFDNFEWVSGYDPKFGIIGVNRKTMERTPKPSAYLLGKIAKSNIIEI